MKMYKEMFRKTAVIGLPLLVVTLVFTLVNGGQDCFGSSYLKQSTSEISMLPVLQYYVFTAILFAFYGFSFLFTRKASDVYHSLPVKRGALYISVTLATATWMGGTIILNALGMLFMLLISGCPFVPAYIPLSILFYFVASMLVFSAAAIGCALSGTIATAVASTGIILFLPRFVQFMFARGIVERVPIVGWLDFGALLNPTSNIATGLVVMHSRQVFYSRIITMGHILYSLIPMLVMLGLGYWLFNRRQSEIAHKNNGNKVWQTITAILLSYTVMLPITMENQKLLSVYGAVLVMASLAVFFVYQLIISQRMKTVLRGMPFFLLALCLLLGTSLLIESAADNMLNITPAPEEIQSVTFRGYDENRGDPAYTTGLIRKIALTDEETKQYVSAALTSAVEDLKNKEDDYDYYDYNPYQVIEPVTIKMTNGKTINRTIEFSNIDTLNAIRMKNDGFAEAVRAFPSENNVQYIHVDRRFTPEESEAIYNTYIAEANEKGLVNGDYYRERAMDMSGDGSTIYRGDSQPIDSISAYGYTGSTRFYDSNRLRLEATKTISLLMKSYNSYVEENFKQQIQEAMERFTSGLSVNDDDFSIQINAFNFPDEEGLVKESVSFYCNKYIMESDSRYDELQPEYMQKFIDMLGAASQTDDPEGLLIRLNWKYYDSTMEDRDAPQIRNTVFLRFDSAEEEQAFIDLINEWELVRRSM